MFKIRNFVYFIVTATLMVSACTAQAPATSVPENRDPAATATLPKPTQTATATATPEPLPEIDPKVQEAMKLCEKVVPGQACLVEGPVVVEAQPKRRLKPFSTPGDTILLADLQRMKVGSPGSTNGIVWLSIPGDTPGETFSVMAFGDVELTNDVLYGSQEFSGMQSLSFSTGEAKDYDQALTRGLMVDAPHDGTLNTLVINGVEMVFGSTAFLTSMGGFLNVSTIFGAVGLNLRDLVQIVEEGKYYNVPREYSTRNVANTEPLRPLTDEEYDALQRQYGVDYRNVITPETVPPERYRRIMEIANAILWGERHRTMENQDNHEPPTPLTDEQWDALEKHYGQKLREILTLENVGEQRYRMLAEEANRLLRGENPGEGNAVKRRIDEKKRMKAWKGGWWKMTYGPATISGKCLMEEAGDGGTGGDGQPYTTEIPICRGNKGNTILMYESGTSYDRVGPNLFHRSYVSMFDLLGNGNVITEGRFTTLQIVSPTRMIFSNTHTEADGCTTSHQSYLDFVRDDPNIRCGLIISIDPYDEPEETTTPKEVPQNVDPPIQGQYQVRLGMLGKICDPAAKVFAPAFSTAKLSLSPENDLVIDAASTRYELELSNLTYPYPSQEMEDDREHLGIFALEQPLDPSFGLMMTVTQMPDQQWSGNWLVKNEDGSKMCSGSIDLLPGE